ncbi:MAG: GTPase Era [Anaerolineales bacterium]
MNEFRSGYIALVGKPNVGKSTLINAVLGQKVAAVSPRPQTTRRRQLGILNTDIAQLVFVDLPGIHKPQHKLGKFLNQEAEEGLIGVDLIFWMVDGSQDPDEEDQLIADMLRELKNPPDIMIGMNKTDRLKTDEEINQQSQKYALLLPAVKLVSFSALRPNSRGELVEKLVEKMPVREADYPTDQLTDLYERDIAADLIREAALFFLRDEVPHGLAVRIDEFTERGSSGAFIAATLFVERDSQKGIVIGEKGLMLKKIGSAARHEIEAMGGRKVFLDLRVKVAKNWRNDENFLNRIGYKIKNTD